MDQGVDQGVDQQVDQGVGRLHAVVPAAGAGSRMNADIPKQYLGINGQTILNHTIGRLLQLQTLDSIVVVLDEATYNAGLLEFNEPKIQTCVGGSNRAESVLNGLQVVIDDNNSVDEPVGMVLVHDAARPCVRVSEIERLISAIAGDVNGGLLAMRIVDTVKRVETFTRVDATTPVDTRLRVVETVDRNQLWRAATPQLFPVEILFHALSCALAEGVEITDEASAMQHVGYSPRLIECSADNIKVTTPTDLALAEYYLLRQRSEELNAQ